MSRDRQRGCAAFSEPRNRSIFLPAGIAETSDSFLGLSNIAYHCGYFSRVAGTRHRRRDCLNLEAGKPDNLLLLWKGDVLHCDCNFFGLYPARYKTVERVGRIGALGEVAPPNELCGAPGGGRRPRDFDLQSDRLSFHR